MGQTHNSTIQGEASKALDYFGLPGPDIRDFHDWGNYLGWKTGIEVLQKKGGRREEQLRKINKLQTNIILDGFSDAWELRKGTLENVILDGVDIDGNKPALLTLEKNHPTRMKYDLHNWDFQGGFGYQNKAGEAKRVEAIKRCITLQKGHAFLFLLTLNVRHTLGEELSIYLTGEAKETYSEKHKRILRWYSIRSASDNTERYRIKAAVTLFIRQIAQVSSFDCYCYPVLYYEGWKEHLLHFVFSLAPGGTVLPFFSQQAVGEVIELPLIEVGNGEFSFASEQHPGFNLERATKLLSLLNLPPGKGR